MRGVWQKLGLGSVFSASKRGRGTRRLGTLMAGVLMACVISQPVMAASSGCNAVAGGVLTATAFGAGNFYDFRQGEAIQFNNHHASDPLDAKVGLPSPWTSIPAGGSVTLIVPTTANQYVGWAFSSTSGSVSATCTAPAAPTISGVSPANGPATGGTSVTISGADFFDVSTVILGGRSVPFTVVNNTTITLVTPQAVPGATTLGIYASAGGVQRSAAFTYDVVPTSINIDTSSLDPATGTLSVSARVSATSGTPSGTITLLVSGTATSPVTLDANGKADLTASGLAPGSQNIQVAYSGGGPFEASQITFSQTVPQRAATVALTSTPNPSVFGVATILTATVTAAVDTPTGTVTFYDGSQALGTSALNGDMASLEIDSFSSGDHSLTATYNGDSNLQAATAALTHTVGRAATTILVSSSANPSTFGQEVTFTAQVQAPVGSPTGSVTFLVNGEEFGTAALDNGIARYATSQLGAGNHNVVARYEGSADYAGSNSSPLAQNIAELANLVIRQMTEGADGAFGFAIMPSATTILVTTMAGQGQSAPLALPAGNYTIVADDMRAAGFGLTSLACTDPNGAIDVASRTARITLAPGDAVTCTFSALNSAEITSALIEDFMETRASLLLESLPDSSRRVGRLNGSVAGNISPGSVLAYLPDIASGSHLPVSASLATLDALAGNRQPSRFDAWIEGSFALFDTDVAGGQLSTVALGADYLITDDLLLGAFAQFDGLNQSADMGAAKIAGDGWLAGPYATLRLTDNLFLDLMAAVGGSTNRVSPFGTYTDEFSAERYLLRATLGGSWTSGDWTFLPRASIGYFEETSQNYTDSLGVTVPSVTTGVGKIALGPGVTYRFPTGDGIATVAGIRLDGTVDIRDEGVAKPHAAINAHVDFALDAGARLGFDLGYGGLGSDTSSLNGKFRLGISTD